MKNWLQRRKAAITFVNIFKDLKAFPENLLNVFILNDVSANGDTQECRTLRFLGCYFGFLFVQSDSELILPDIEYIMCVVMCSLQVRESSAISQLLVAREANVQLGLGWNAENGTWKMNVSMRYRSTDWVPEL